MCVHVCVCVCVCVHAHVCVNTTTMNVLSYALTVSLDLYIHVCEKVLEQCQYPNSHFTYEWSCVVFIHGQDIYSCLSVL